MKVRIKRKQIQAYLDTKISKKILLDGHEYASFKFQEEIELQISESDIVKEKSNCEKWEEIFMKIGDMETIEMIEGWSKDKADLFDLNGIDATQAYEKIVEGK